MARDTDHQVITRAHRFWNDTLPGAMRMAADWLEENELHMSLWAVEVCEDVKDSEQSLVIVFEYLGLYDRLLGD